MKNLIIDANLLILLIIGSVDEGVHIRSSKRLKKYNIDDYNKVLEIISRHDDVFITPYIATEVSNLLDMEGEIRSKIFVSASYYFAIFKDIHTSIKDDSEGKNFLEFGITDNSLIRLAPHYYILTDDTRMLNLLLDASPYTIIPYSWL